MFNIEALQAYGADTQEGLTRCFGNEAFYLKLVKMILDEKSFGNLKDALDNNDLDKAFEAAHALKGVVANLSLTPIFTPASEITEHLRAREEMDYAPLLEEIFAQKEKLEELINSD